VKPFIQILLSPIVIGCGVWILSRALRSPRPPRSDRIIGMIGGGASLALGIASLVFGIRALIAA
jgi:hypothetical protein